MPKTIALIGAFICFLFAALGVKALVDWTNAGFALVTLSLLV